MATSPAASRRTPRPLLRVLRLDRPLDLRLTLGTAWRGPSDPAMRLGADEVWRVTRTPLGGATQRLRAAGDRVRVEAWGPGAAWVMEHAPALIGEEDDDSGFTPRHPLVAELRRRMPGLRLPRTAAVIEALVPAILEQKVAGTEAHRSLHGLAAGFGETAPGPAPGLRLLPAPRQLATIPSWEYHRLGVERRRADTIRAVARCATRMEETSAMEPGEARRRLMAVPGVGPWTAAVVCLRALGDADAVPLGDFHLPHLVSWVFAGEPRGSDDRMLELLEPYSGHRGRVLRLLVSAGLHAPRFGPRLPLRRIASL